jgi:hypothetical protein
VNIFFHETKIPTIDKKISVYSNFSKTNWKKMKCPSSLLSEGARLKKWECCTSILPKCQVHLQTSS